MTTNHREILAALIYGIRQRQGFMTLVGEAGTGKTVLLSSLLDRLDDKTKVAKIINTGGPFEQILQMTLMDLGLANPENIRSKSKAIQMLNDFSIERLASGGNVVFIVDEAQNLDCRSLENLGLLSDLRTGHHKLVQIILSGQPELDAKLNQNQIRQLAQQISLRRYLSPFNEKDTRAYLHHRLNIANYRGSFPFSHKALKMIWGYSGGIPRKINLLCDNAFLIGYRLKKKKIRAPVVGEAILRLSRRGTSEGIETSPLIPSAETASKLGRTKFHPRLAMALVLVVAAGLTMWFGPYARLPKPYFQSSKPFSSQAPVQPRNSGQPLGSSQNPNVAPPNPQPRGDRAKKAEESLSKYPYTIQLASCRLYKSAQHVVSYYKDLGFSPYIVKADLEKEGVWWIAYMGHFKTRDQAERIIKANQISDALIVNERRRVGEGSAVP